MALSLLIGGISRRWKNGTLGIVETLGGRSTCDFSLEILQGEGWAPYVGVDVVVLDGAIRLFAGSIESVEVIRYHGNAAVLHRVSCIDHHRILDRRLAGEYNWQQQTAGQIVRDICNNSLQGEGIDTAFVQDGPVIEEFSIDYPTVAEAIDQVARVAKMLWLVDYQKNLRFFSPETYACPFELNNQDANFTSLGVRSTREKYANRMLVRLGQFLRPEQTARFDGAGRSGEGEEADASLTPDGERNRFWVTHPLGAEPKVTVNGSPKTVGIWGTDQTRDWYWSLQSRNLEQDPEATPLATGDVLEVTYVGVEQNWALAENPDEMALRATIEGGTGWYETLRTANDPTTRSQAQQLAESLLDQVDELSATAEVVLNTIREPLASTARVGQRIHIDVSDYIFGGRSITGVAYGAPVRIVAPAHGRLAGERVLITGVDAADGAWTVGNVSRDEFDLVGSSAAGSYGGGGWFHPLSYIIRQIRVYDVPGLPHLAYLIEAVAGPIIGDAVQFFQGLAAADGVPTAVGQPQEGTGAEAPDHVTNAAVTGQTQKVVRGQVLNEITVQYNAPPAGEPRNEDFHGVRVTYIEADGTERPKGLFEHRGPVGAEGIEFTIEHNAPFNDVDELVRLVAENRQAAADAATAPVIQFRSAGKDGRAFPPTNVTLTVLDKPDDASKYGLQAGWLKPETQGGTIGYDTRVGFFADEAMTEPVSPYKYPGTQDGYDTEGWFDGYWDKPQAGQYAVFGARGRSAYPDQPGGVSEWVDSAPVLVGDRGTVVTQPAGITAQVIGIRTDTAGEQWARIRISGTAGTNNDRVNIHTVRTEDGAAQPAAEAFGEANPENPGGGFDVTPNAAFSFEEFWAKRPAGQDAERLWIAVVGHGQGLGIWFGLGVATVVSVLLDPRSMAPQITAASVLVETKMISGILKGRFKFTFGPTVSPEFWYCRIDRVFTDELYNPLPGQSYEENGYFGPDSSPHTQPDYEWDVPNEAQHLRWRFRAVNQAGEPNNENPFFVNMTIQPSTGFDPAGIPQQKLGPTLLVDEQGRLVNLALTFLEQWGLSENDFEQDGTGRVKLKDAVIQRLLTAYIELLGVMRVSHPESQAYILLDANGFSAVRGANSTNVTPDGVVITGGGTTLILGSNWVTAYGLQVLGSGGGFPLLTVAGSELQVQGALRFVGNGTVDFNQSGAVYGLTTAKVTGLDSALANKSDTGHGHSAAAISGLGTAATKNVGSGADQVAAGDHSHGAEEIDYGGFSTVGNELWLLWSEIVSIKSRLDALEV